VAWDDEAAEDEGAGIPSAMSIWLGFAVGGGELLELGAAEELIS